jgi:hypothetical protein
MNLETIIFEMIPAAMLERVVFDQGVLDARQRIELFKASGLSAKEIARKTVEAYGPQSPRLAYGLYDQISQSNWEAAKLLAEHIPGLKEDAHHNHQASLVGRIPTIPLSELNEFLTSTKSRVCLIVSRNGAGPATSGTGFLVGPDLVLTCRHVLKTFPDGCDIHADDRRIELYFDFHQGDPVQNVGPNLPLARKVGLDKSWLVASGAATEPDGMLGPLTAEDIARISGSLDFVLLRLEEPLGLQPIDRGGGRRRGWIPLPPDGVPRKLFDEDWIIIPQHPFGFPQRIDVGRFRERDQTKTRIWYSTNTAKGTSGAPCFNQSFHLVGVHNAYVGPEANPVANQAIQFDLIMAHIKDRVSERIGAATDAGIPTLRWSTSRPNERPRVILGRQKLLEWLRDSARVTPRNLAERVYAAQAKKARAGCSFSGEVLDAATRDSKTPRAVYGEHGQQLPAAPEDFLISLLRELGIDRKQWDIEGSRMPQRPTAVAEGRTLPSLNSEVDKLDRWLSDSLPKWLDEVITKHVEKEIDIRPAVKDAVEGFKKLGAPPPLELVAQAESPHPIYVRPNAWDCAYVVIDDLRPSAYLGSAARIELKGEVYRLIAALVNGKSERLMTRGLKRLRWMLLGCLPDFIAADEGDGNGATTEVLDPDAIGANDVLAVFDRISQSHLRTDPDYKAMASAVARFLLKSAASQVNSVETLLVRLQIVTSEFAATLLEESGKLGNK